MICNDGSAPKRLEIAMTTANPPVRAGAHRLRRRRRRPAYVPVLAILAGWTVMVLTAPHVRAGSDLHRAALFVHLASLVLGFGAVLTLDWSGLMWMLRRHDLLTLVRIAQVVHTPVWLGLAGLALSGMLLGPDTTAPLTVVKLLAVLAVAVNGLGAAVVQRRLLALDGRIPPLPLLVTAVAVAGVSQLGWWTATVVGFLNAQR
jgi:hypothetical protein